jgi:hypothetical protein
MEQRIMLKRAAMCFCFAMLAAAPASGQRMYKCVDAKGKVYYTQVPPTECLGREMHELNKAGTVIRREEAMPTPEQIAEREAEKKRKAEAEERAKEEKRKNLALLSTYSSEKDIEEARARALKENEDAVVGTEKRIQAALQRRKVLTSEKEFYAKKSLPPKLTQDIETLEVEIKAQQAALEVRKKQVSAINAKYDEDKKRYLELTAVSDPRARAQQLPQQKDRVIDQRLNSPAAPAESPSQRRDRTTTTIQRRDGTTIYRETTR